MSKWRYPVGIVVILSFGVVAQASGATSADELGSVLAAESPCHFTYDVTAIQNYIVKNVSEDDMAFGNALQGLTEVHKIVIQSMTPATLAAFCTQTARVAKFNGFIH